MSDCPHFSSHCGKYRLHPTLTDAHASLVLCCRSIKGRLKVCSRSIFFDPEDNSIPIIRYDYNAMVEVETLRNGSIAQLNNGETFFVKTKQMVQMKDNNIVRPYVFQNGEVLHRFAIKYATVKNLLEEVKRLWSIAKNSSAYEPDDKIRKVLEEREVRVSFDMTWMESLDERMLFETLANKITPLVSNAGRLVITNKMIYFQPLNNVSATPVEKLPLRECIRIIKRRHELRPLGLEVFCEDSNAMHKDSSVSSVFFSFRDSATRDRLFDVLTTLPGMPRLEHENQSQMTWKWQCGALSNYEYLTYLNSLAHRSFNDLTQYPVFPWILADYTSQKLNLADPNSYRDLSKPIGALNPERIASFRKRFAEMPEDPDHPRFMYGTHYSTPAYVLYYLVRSAPEYMLKLQNGRFDEAERLFNSIADTWENVLTNSADLKELIPEFFSTELQGGRPAGEFLTNHQDVNFGRRADGMPVGDVSLPPWANGSASEFIRLNREALESEYVSSKLHLWIDLIFGHKQRGAEAIKADNLFHPLTYEGAVDIEKERDPARRRAILIQINEFGQTPAKIFDGPHPLRLPAEERRKLASSPSAAGSASASTISAHETNTFSRSSPYASLSGSASSLPYYSPNTSLSSLPPYNAASAGGASTSSFQSQLSPLSPERPSLASSTPSTPKAHAPRAFGTPSLNNSLTSGLGSSTPSSGAMPISSPLSSSQQRRSAYDLATSEPLFTPVVNTAPDPSIENMLGQLGQIQLSSSPGIVISEHQLELLLNQQIAANLEQQHHQVEESHAPAPSTAAPARSSGFVDEWSNFANFAPVETWKSHRQGVTSLALSNDGETLYSVSQDSSLKIYSLGEGKQLRSNNISQLALSSCVLSRDQKYVAIGSWDNNIYLYSNDYGRVVTTVQAHDDTVSCLALRDQLLVSGSWDTSFKVWQLTPSGMSQDPMIELSCLDSAVRAVHLDMDSHLALCGSDDGMLAVADVRSGSVVRTWSAHDDAIAAAQFTNDGRIISCSVVGTMKVQDGCRGSEPKDIFAINIPTGFHCFATNGTRLITGDASSMLRTWDLLLGEEVSRVRRSPESPITCLAPSENCDFIITGAEDGSLTKWAKK